MRVGNCQPTDGLSVSRHQTIQRLPYQYSWKTDPVRLTPRVLPRTFLRITTRARSRIIRAVWPTTNLALNRLALINPWRPIGDASLALFRPSFIRRHASSRVVWRRDGLFGE